jgi:Na+-driven multidrug efflux pump
VLYFLFDGWIYQLISDEPNLIALAERTTAILGITMLAYAVGGVLFHSVIGTGAARVAFWTEIAAAALFLVLAVGLSFVSTDLRVLWLSEFLYMGTLLVASWMYLRTGRWRSIAL